MVVDQSGTISYATPSTPAAHGRRVARPRGPRHHRRRPARGRAAPARAAAHRGTADWQQRDDRLPVRIDPAARPGGRRREPARERARGRAGRHLPRCHRSPRVRGRATHPGAARPAHRPREPGALQRPAGAGAAPRTPPSHSTGRPVPGPRHLQVHQRHAGAHGRRRGPPGGRPPPADRAAAGGHGRAIGRRRVRRPRRGHHRRERGGRRRRAHPSCAGGTVRRRRPGPGHLGLHRHRTQRIAGRRPRLPAAQRRHRHVRGQARGTGRPPGL